MAEGFALADAFVRIRPTATGFRSETEAQVKAALTGISPEIKIGASTAAAQLKVAALRGLLDKLARENYAARITADDTRLYAQLARDQAALYKLRDTIADPEIDLKGAAQAEASMLGILAGMKKINATIANARVKVDDADGARRVALLTVQLNALADKAYDIRLKADPADLPLVERIIAEITHLKNETDRIDFNLVPAAFGLPVLEHQFKKLSNELGQVLPAAMNRARIGYLGFWNILARPIPLFGGALGAAGFVAVWHLIADAIIEAAAVLIPAGLAFAAFAAGAVDGVQHIVLHMQALNTVTSAFGQHILPLARGGIASLEDAITPRVFTLFGEAVAAGQAKLKDFATLAQGAGNVMTQLGARIEQAITSSQFTVFLKNATSDLARVGDIIGNFFGIIGNLLKSVTKSADILLQAIDILSKALENLTGSPVFQWLARLAIGMHAFWLWVGLATTAVLYMIPVLARWTGGLSLLTQNASGLERVKLATRDLGSNLGLVSGGTRGIIPSLKEFVAKMVTAGGAAEDAAKGTKLWSFAVGVVKSIGWGWVGIGALAIAGLAFALASVKDRTEQWIGDLQQAIDRTATWGNVIDKQVFALAQLNRAAASQAQAVSKTTQAQNASQRALSRQTFQVTDATRKYWELHAAQGSFAGQLNTTGFRVGEMARRFGGFRQAMALAQAAGIKVTDMLHGSKDAFARDLIVIQGLIHGYQNAGVAQDNLGHAVEALQLVNEDQLRSVQNLDQAWSQLLQIVGGGESTFVTFAQDMLSANKALAQTGGTPRVVTSTFNSAASATQRAADAARRAHVAFNGLNAQSLQLRATWGQSITAAQAYYNALSTQAAAASDGAKGQALLLQAGEDLIKILAPAAKGSATLRQQVYLLAQQFGISTKAMDGLINNSGKMKKNEKDLQLVNLQLAKSVSNVSRDWARMATTLNDQVKSALDAVALKSSGASYAAEHLYRALHHQGAGSKEAHDWYKRLIEDLHNAGLSWQQARDYAAAYTKGLGFNADEIARSAVNRLGLQQDTTQQKQLYDNVRGALDKYSGALDKNTSKTNAGRQARQNLVKDLFSIGYKANLSTTAIEKMIARILRIPKREVLDLLMHGTGSWKIQQISSLSRPGGKLSGPMASGGRVPGYGGGDRFPAMLEGGEAVVPKHLVPAVAPFLGAHKVPGFTSGGFASSGSYPHVAPPAGDFLYGAYTTFKRDMTNALVSDLRSGIRTALTSFPGGGGAFSGGGSGVQRWAPVALQAMASLGIPAGDLGIVLSQMATESGGNPFVVNKWDSNWLAGHPSVGLMQVIAGTFDAYAGPFRNIGPFEYGVSVNPLANIFSALNYAIHRYGAGWTSVLGHGHGYDKGGWLSPGLTMAWNGTGRAERVLGPGETQPVVLEIHAGASAFDQALAEIIRRYVRVRGGNVQLVLGRN